VKVIDVPKPVKLKLLTKRSSDILEEVERPFTFSQFLIGACEGYKAFATGLKMARQYNKIMDIVESINNKKSVQLEDDDFGVVKAAVEAASWTTPSINRSCIPFYEAVENAEDVKTLTKKKK